MQWNKGKHAGFSTVVPWFTLNPNYRKINAAEEEKDPDSILHFYRKCIALRKRNEALLFGSYREYMHHSRRIYMYERRKGAKSIP